MPHDPEQKRLAGQRGKVHGVYAVKARGEEALDAAGIQTLREIEAGLETPEGIILAMRKRVAMSLMVLAVLETYLEEQVNAGHTPDSLPVFRAWPSFQNSTVRSLMHLRSMLPKQQVDSYADALRRIDALLDEHDDTQRGSEQAPD